MFNKKLARLESLYGVETKPITEVTSLQVSEFIDHVFENQNQYKLEGVSKEWFLTKPSEECSKIISGLLLENGHRVIPNVILEGVEVFKNGIV